jgi:soluble lytic murein transglycosylase
MSSIRGLCFICVLLVLGCHSTPLKNPPLTGPDAPRQLQWQKDYKEARAQTDASKACPAFQRLAGEKAFPGHDIAQLRAWESCASTQASQIDRTQVPSYLKDSALEVALTLAQAQKDKAGVMTLAAEKSRQKLPQAEKLRWVKLALSSAQELSDDERIAEYTRREYQIAPRLNPEPKEKDYLTVAADFRLARQFEKAREYYEKVVQGGFKIDDKISALKGIRLSYKNARQNDAHLAACERLADFLNQAIKKNPKQNSLRVAAYDAEVYHARALWTQGHATQARQIFEKLEKRMKGRVSIAELYWLKARMADEDKDYATVSTSLDKALKEKITDTSLRDKIMWYAGWNERRQNHFAAAVDRFHQLDEQTQDEFIRVRGLFWLGKSQTEDKKADEAKATFARVVDLDPLGYYGLLAHRQLGQEISLKPTVAGKAIETPTIPLDTVLAEWLNLLDERDALTALLDEAAMAYRKLPTQSDEGWIALFKYYAKAGLYMKLYDSLAGLSPERRKSVLENHPELLFPQPWSEEVRTASLQFGVKPELIYAIMRQESAFDPHARSLADAFGLLQVLPEVAEHLAKANGIAYEDMESLYEPQTNIQVGAAHLKELMARYKSQFILAVCAYNANDTAIHNWMSTRFRGDALEFIEEIPYEETRVYVRLVMRNLIFYSLLNSQSASIEFPNWLLKLDAT